MKCCGNIRKCKGVCVMGGGGWGGWGRGGLGEAGGWER